MTRKAIAIMKTEAITILDLKTFLSLFVLAILSILVDDLMF